MAYLKEVKVSQEFINSLIPFNKKTGQCLQLNKVLSSDGGLCNDVFEVTGEALYKGLNGDIYKVCCSKSCNFIGKWIPTTSKVEEDEYESHMKASAQGISPKIHKVLSCDDGDFLIMDKLNESLLDSLQKFNKEQKMYTVNYIKSLLQNKDLIFKMDIHSADYNLEMLTDYLKGDIKDNYRATEIILERGVDLPRFVLPLDSPERKEQMVEDVRACISVLQQLYKYAGLIHHDAHPGNFMCDDRRNWYIIDFGLSTPISRNMGDETTDVLNLTGTIKTLSRLMFGRFDHIFRSL